MTGYEKILGVMNRQANKNFPKGLQLAVVGKDLSVMLDGLTLEKSDLIYSEILITGYIDKNGKAMQPLKEGDTVIIKRLSEEKYIVLCKAVNGDA